MELTEKQCSESKWDFSNLKALFLNCSLKPTHKQSHTDNLIEISQTIMQKNGVNTKVLRAVDYDIAPGVYPDMTEEGFDNDDWSQIQQKVMNASMPITDERAAASLRAPKTASNIAE